MPAAGGGVRPWRAGLVLDHSRLHDTHKHRATHRQLGGRGVLRGVGGGRRGGGEDPWLCGPGFRRVCLYRGSVATLVLDSNGVNAERGRGDGIGGSEAHESSALPHEGGPHNE
jgi:hypothetical protein